MICLWHLLCKAANGRSFFWHNIMAILKFTILCLYPSKFFSYDKRLAAVVVLQSVIPFVKLKLMLTKNLFKNYYTWFTRSYTNQLHTSETSSILQSLGGKEWNLGYWSSIIQCQWYLYNGIITISNLYKQNQYKF